MYQPPSIIPIFPLSAVLFPQMILPLHIFEERYKLLLQDCLDANSRFGVALIKEGAEVGDPAVPCDVGTVARIRRVAPLDDGRFELLVQGERRFRIREITQWKPYEKALVSYPGDIEGDPPMGLWEVEDIRDKAAAYLRTVLGLQGGWSARVDSPTDPVELSYYIASVTRGNPQERQAVLEAPSGRQRLAMLLPALETATKANTEQMKERFLLKGIRLN